MSCSYEWSQDSWTMPQVSGEKEIVSGLGVFGVDFLSFLAVAQALEIRFLPISWDAARQDIGLGGTARISQALADTQTSFAFKRIRDRDKREDVILQILANEITVMSHDAIREHPNIVQLQGLSWDVRELHDKPWPVLIFEKSEFGDLYTFASSPMGRRMSFDDRLKLCIDIGQAITTMHSSGIIHGDIKPQNILIFREESGKICAKVTDFGYSTRYADKNYRVKLPKSPPWNAPEYRAAREWTHSQAVKLDIFSFGLLCFWLLFEPHLSRINPVPENFDSVTDLTYKSMMETLERVKENPRTEIYVRQFLQVENNLDENRRKELREFFKLSLMNNPQERKADLFCLLQMLDSRASKQNIPSMELGHLPPIAEFKIEPSIHDFYRCDYRVRSYIFQKILEASRHSSTLATQLAFCYYVGFGTPRDEPKSIEILVRNERDPGLMLEMISKIRDEMDIRPALLLERMWMDGLVGGDGDRHASLNREALSNAEKQILQEMRDLVTVAGEEDSLTMIVKTTAISLYCLQKRWKEAEELELEVLRVERKAGGDDSHFTLARMNSLAFIYHGQGRWKEAGDVFAQVYERTKSALGEEHRYTLTSMGNLAQILSTQGRQREAEELKLEEIEIKEKIFGNDHRFTLIAMSNLATIYIGQDRLREAEDLLTRTVAAKKRAMGPEHPSTLVSMGNLGLLHSQAGHLDEADKLLHQTAKLRREVLGEEHPDTLGCMNNLAEVKKKRGHWQEAEDIETQVLRAMKRVLGDEHPTTLIVTGNLATTYSRQGRHEEAKALEIHVMETLRKNLGQEHPHTLTSMNNLAETYNALGELKEAGELQIRVLEISRRVLGEEHSDTLMRLANLASTRRDQGLWEEAEGLELHVMEAMERVLGKEHPNTITSMSNLAVTYKKQGRWEDAEALMVQVVELRGKVFGNKHPDTRRSLMVLVFMLVGQGRSEEATELIQKYDTVEPKANDSNVDSDSSEAESSDDDSLDAEGNSRHARSKVPYRNPWLKPDE